MNIIVKLHENTENIKKKIVEKYKALPTKFSFTEKIGKPHRKIAVIVK